MTIASGIAFVVGITVAALVIGIAVAGGKWVNGELMIGDLIRSFFGLFGRRYVVLYDFDGEQHLRRVCWRGGRAFARRHPYDITNVWLLDDGALTGASFVKRWEPYTPFQPKTWPKFETRATQ